MTAQCSPFSVLYQLEVVVKIFLVIQTSSGFHHHHRRVGSTGGNDDVVPDLVLTESSGLNVSPQHHQHLHTGRLSVSGGMDRASPASSVNTSRFFILFRHYYFEALTFVPFLDAKIGRSHKISRSIDHIS